MSFSRRNKMRIAVGVSGGGRSLENLLAKAPGLPFEIAMVFSSSPEIRANDVARDAGLPLYIFDFSRGSVMETRKKLNEAFAGHRIDLVVLAGFLKLMPVDEGWVGKIINIHPALLPKFGGKGMHGMNVHRAVIEAGEGFSGATVHFVNEKYDDGAIVARSTVRVLAGDAPSDLAARVFASECELLPWVLTELAEGRLPAQTVPTLNHAGERL